MRVVVGNIVRLRDGRVLEVTDAVDYEAPEAQKNPDNIIIGYTLGGSRLVTNTDEVVSILA